MVVAPFIVVLLACEVAYRPPLLIEPPEGMALFIAGYLYKLADVRGVCPRCLWWTALFHALTAYVMALPAMVVRGADGRKFLPLFLPRFGDQTHNSVTACLLSLCGCCVVIGWWYCLKRPVQAVRRSD